jgi:hypothetical protein
MPFTVGFLVSGAHEQCITPPGTVLGIRLDLTAMMDPMHHDRASDDHR